MSRNNAGIGAGDYGARAAGRRCPHQRSPRQKDNRAVAVPRAHARWIDVGGRSHTTLDHGLPEPSPGRQHHKSADTVDPRITALRPRRYPVGGTDSDRTGSQARTRDIRGPLGGPVSIDFIARKLVVRSALELSRWRGGRFAWHATHVMRSTGLTIRFRLLSKIPVNCAHLSRVRGEMSIQTP